MPHTFRHPKPCIPDEAAQKLNVCAALTLTDRITTIRAGRATEGRSVPARCAVSMYSVCLGAGSRRWTQSLGGSVAPRQLRLGPTVPHRAGTVSDMHALLPSCSPSPSSRTYSLIGALHADPAAHPPRRERRRTSSRPCKSELIGLGARWRVWQWTECAAKALAAGTTRKRGLETLDQDTCRCHDGAVLENQDMAAWRSGSATSEICLHSPGGTAAIRRATRKQLIRGRDRG